MKKILTLITLLLTTSAFAVDFTIADFKQASATYESKLAYLDSLTGIANDDYSIQFIGNSTIEQFKLWSIINTKFGAAHHNKSAEFVAQAQAEAKELFYANVNKLTNNQVFQIADRIGDFATAVSKFEAVKATSMTPQDKINFAIKFYKAGALSKDAAVATLIEASTNEIKDPWFPALAKAVDSIPVRGTDGKVFMTDEQKKEFYGNFKSLNKVTKASANFLGAVVTQYNLVK